MLIKPRMPVYYLNLFVVVLAAIVSKKSDSKSVERWSLVVIFISLVLVAGLRDQSVGTDSGAYASAFAKMKSLSLVGAIGSQFGEWGFWVLNWVLSLISTEYMLLFFAIAILVVGSYLKTIVDNSVSIEISLFVFLTTGVYLFFFNGARQGLACAVYSLAMAPMMNRNFIKYAGFVLLAFLFHKTAIVLLPAYFIFNKASSLKYNMLTIAIACLSILLIESIVDFASSIDGRYSSYGTSGDGGGYIVAGYNVLLGAFFLIFKNYIHLYRYQYDRFLNMFLFGAMIAVVSTVLQLNPSGLLRYSHYFGVTIIFLWPIVFLNITDRLTKFIIGYSFAIFYVFYFQLTTERFSNLVPYVFNPLLFR